MKATIRRNHQKNGIEIVFPSKPTEEVLQWIKDRNFKYSKFANLWYNQYSESLYNEVVKYFEEKGEVEQGVRGEKKEAEKDQPLVFSKYQTIPKNSNIIKYLFDNAKNIDYTTYHMDMADNYDAHVTKDVDRSNLFEKIKEWNEAKLKYEGSGRFRLQKSSWYQSSHLDFTVDGVMDKKEFENKDLKESNFYLPILLKPVFGTDNEKIKGNYDNIFAENQVVLFGIGYGFIDKGKIIKVTTWESTYGGKSKANYDYTIQSDNGGKFSPSGDRIKLYNPREDTFYKPVKNIFTLDDVSGKSYEYKHPYYVWTKMLEEVSSYDRYLESERRAKKEVNKKNYHKSAEIIKNRIETWRTDYYFWEIENEVHKEFSRRMSGETPEQQEQRLDIWSSIIKQPNDYTDLIFEYNLSDQEKEALRAVRGLKMKRLKYLAEKELRRLGKTSKSSDFLGSLYWGIKIRNDAKQKEEYFTSFMLHNQKDGQKSVFLKEIGKGGSGFGYPVDKLMEEVKEWILKNTNAFDVVPDEELNKIVLPDIPESSTSFSESIQKTIDKINKRQEESRKAMEEMASKQKQPTTEPIAIVGEEPEKKTNDIKMATSFDGLREGDIIKKRDNAYSILIKKEEGSVILLDFWSYGWDDANNLGRVKETTIHKSLFERQYVSDDKNYKLSDINKIIGLINKVSWKEYDFFTDVTPKQREDLIKKYADNAAIKLIYDKVYHKNLTYELATEEKQKPDFYTELKKHIEAKVDSMNLTIPNLFTIEYIDNNIHIESLSIGEKVGAVDIMLDYDKEIEFHYYPFSVEDRGKQDRKFFPKNNLQAIYNYLHKILFEIQQDYINAKELSDKINPKQEQNLIPLSEFSFLTNVIDTITDKKFAFEVRGRYFNYYWEIKGDFANVFISEQYSVQDAKDFKLSSPVIYSSSADIHTSGDTEFGKLLYESINAIGSKAIEEAAGATVEIKEHEKEAWEMDSVEFYHDKSLKLNIEIDKTNKEKPSFRYSIVVPYKVKGSMRGDKEMEFSIVRRSQYTHAAMEELHKKIIQQALIDEKPVPENVLAEYPDLKQKSKIQTETEYDFTNLIKLSEIKFVTPYIQDEYNIKYSFEWNGKYFTYNYREGAVSGLIFIREQKTKEDAINFADKTNFIYNSTKPKLNTELGKFLEYSLRHIGNFNISKAIEEAGIIVDTKEIEKEKYDFNNPIKLSELKFITPFVQDEYDKKYSFEWDGKYFTYNYRKGATYGLIFIREQETKEDAINFANKTNFIYSSTKPKENTKLGSYIEYSLTQIGNQKIKNEIERQQAESNKPEIKRPSALAILDYIIPPMQMRGQDFSVNKLALIDAVEAAMKDKDRKAGMVYLHYFTGNVDLYVKGIAPQYDEDSKTWSFGLWCFGNFFANGEFEYGWYYSDNMWQYLPKLIELEYYFRPTPLSKINDSRNKYYEEPVEEFKQDDIKLKEAEAKARIRILQLQLQAKQKAKN